MTHKERLEKIAADLQSTADSHTRDAKYNRDRFTESLEHSESWAKAYNAAAGAVRREARIFAKDDS